MSSGEMSRLKKLLRSLRGGTRNKARVFGVYNAKVNTPFPSEFPKLIRKKPYSPRARNVADTKNFHYKKSLFYAEKSAKICLKIVFCK